MALADYMNSYLGDLATELGWTVASGSYSFPVDDSVEAYGETLEANCADSVKLHAIGKVKVLEAVCMATANAVDYAADTSSFKMSQIHAQAKAMLSEARTDALPYLPEYAIELGEFTYASDPYERLESLDGGE